MPTYDFNCEKCDLDFEVIKSIKLYDTEERCPTCGNVAIRKYTCNIHFTGTKIEDAEYNPGLGKITKSKRHREELAKRLGAVEIGNEKPQTIHKHFDSARETKRKKSWDDV